MIPSKAMLRTTLLCIAAALGTACIGSSTATGPNRSAAQIPIKRVILYQNGVGYFERQGTLDGNVLTLQIRPSQINDLLKSLTVIDKSKGRAVSVSLPLEKTGAQRLSELPEQVRNAGGLLDVLRVFRGAHVRVTSSRGTMSGRIVGVEPIQERNAVSGNTANVDWRLTLKTGSEDLQVVPVSAISRISLRDRTLSFGLDQSLDVSLNQGNWKPIAFEVRLTGDREHKLLASYIIEMPQWKPAYRLVLDDQGKQPLLQGWAVVDNVSGEDWNQVQLSLVAGTPMSFIYDLHSPQFPKRVDLTPRHRTSAPAPVTERSGYVGGTKDRLQRRYSRSRRAASANKPSAADRRVFDRPGADKEGEEAYDGDDDGDGWLSDALGQELERQAPSSAGGQQVGALFRYDIKDKVTIPDRSSTLVAIVNERVKGQEVVLFRPELTRGVRKSNPYRAVMFENGTGSTLEKGPVTIYSRGTFVGEGFVERMQQASTSFLTYSIDGNVTSANKMGTKDEGLRLLKIIDGMITSEVLRVETTTYSLDNKHAESITAYFKTMKRQGWKLRSRPANTVETADAFFVPVTVSAQGTAELPVEWVRPTTRRVGIDTSLSTTVLQIYMNAGEAPRRIRKTIKEILDIKRQLNDLAEEAARLEKLHRAASADQARVRKNLKLLTKTKGNQALRNELTRKLAKQEQELGKLSGQLVRLSEQQAGLKNRMNALIRTISLDVSEN